MWVHTVRDGECEVFERRVALGAMPAVARGAACSLVNFLCLCRAIVLVF